MANGGSVQEGSLERGLVSIVVGLVAAALVIIALEPLLQGLVPVPGLNPLDAAAELREQVAALPRASFMVVLGGYALASLVGGISTSLTSGRAMAWPPLATGAILAVAGTYGVLVVYQPLWFRGVSFLTYPMAWVGHLLVRRAR